MLSATALLLDCDSAKNAASSGGRGVLFIHLVQSDAARQDAAMTAERQSSGHF